jgi:hypothetical protein
LVDRLFRSDTEREGRLSKHDPVWGRIRELHAKRFAKTVPVDETVGGLR